MTQEKKGTSTAGRPGKPSTGMDEKRVFINDNGQGTFICPACNKGVIRDLSEFLETRSAIRLKCKCSCGHRYRVLVERRRHFRKPVNLTGMFIFQNSQGNPVKGLIKILDISQSGACFSVNSIPEFQIGDKLTIEFNLDDEDRSQIREVGTVRRIQTNIVGLSFKNTDHYGKLGQYLFR
jgi:c-di-GMP-binding flagellar brake protein YcgR